MKKPKSFKITEDNDFEEVEEEVPARGGGSCAVGILAGKSEGQWTNEKGCTVVSDYVYNESVDQVFSKSTYRSPNNRVYQDGASFIDFHEYTYDCLLYTSRCV